MNKFKRGFNASTTNVLRGISEEMTTTAVAQQKDKVGEVQLYPEKSPFLSAFWREKYEKEAQKNWDIFYKRNGDKFFKNRNYLDKEWGTYFLGSDDGGNVSQDDAASVSLKKIIVILEVGCGTGNTVFPLLSKYPHLFCYACDFSLRAVGLLKAHQDYEENRVKAFVCDVTSDSLTDTLPPASVDIVTLVFMLSSLSPEKMPLVLCNVKRVLKPGGHVLVRDYATGDLAEERLFVKDQKISDHFFVRGDGTRAFYFSEESLKILFMKEDFQCKEMKVHARKVENRSRKIVMNRRWIQGAFYYHPSVTQRCTEICRSSTSLAKGPISPMTVSVQSLGTSALQHYPEVDLSSDLVCPMTQVTLSSRREKQVENEVEVSLSEGAAAELFLGTPVLEVVDVCIGIHTIHARCLSKENQHTFASTGFILWESALAFAELLSLNTTLTKGKTILELGSGSVGICSLMACRNARKVTATDGDQDALVLLKENLQRNSADFPVDSISCHYLLWGRNEHIASLRSANCDGGFQLIMGTDVTYVLEDVPLLFQTARALLAEPSASTPEPLLVLCHLARRVSEIDILSAAIAHGFFVKGLWASGAYMGSKPEQEYVKMIFQEGLDMLRLNFPCMQILCLSATPQSGLEQLCKCFD